MKRFILFTFIKICKPLHTYHYQKVDALPRCHFCVDSRISKNHA